ncbi:MAG TPA: hypothetical protein VNN20_01495 [Thermodesulfobacteriota bacterium]|jgi:uncharacterized linocin/CFP29 family protein|nr:hypothetical protein [Thermodesulfobacteriota bacterium]
MSKKIVNIEVFECDHVDEKGVRCDSEGQRQAIKECAVCKKDLCSRHYQTFSISSLSSPAGTGVSLTYFLCWQHAEEFVNTVVQTLGDSRPVPYGGMAK